MSAEIFTQPIDERQSIITDYDPFMSDVDIMIAVGACQPNASTKRVAQHLDRDTDMVRNRLHELAEKGRLQRDVIGTSYVWSIIG